MYLVVNRKTLDVSRRVNSTIAVFTLADVWAPSSTVNCRLRRDPDNTLVGGLSLSGGRTLHPAPDPPPFWVCPGPNRRPPSSKFLPTSLGT